MEAKKKSTAKKSDKPKTVFNEIPAERRAKGVTLPKGARLIFVRNSEDPLPTNLQPVLAKIAAKGKDGIPLKSLLPDDKAQASYQRWLVRILVKLGLVKAEAVEAKK